MKGFPLLLFAFFISVLPVKAGVPFKVTKVDYSLPESGIFNISLNKGDIMVPPFELGRNGVKKIVLDAGHGGKDHGCSGKNSVEKDIALDITLKLGQLIRKHHPDVEVIYTRKKDEFIELHERASIANRHKADLFISIHCNTTPKKNSAIGTETFVMGLHRAEDNLQVAKRENSVIEQEEDYLKHYDGYDPNSPEAHIVLSMYQNAFLDQSIKLANMIESEFQSYGQRVSRGVKQAGFLVLRNTVMPSVLIEAGFLNHSKEEMILTSEEGKERTATAIFNAFTTYKLEMDRQVASSSSPQNPKDEALHTSNATATNGNSLDSVIEPEPVNYVERAKKEMERLKKMESSGNKTQTRTEGTIQQNKPAVSKPASNIQTNTPSAKQTPNTPPSDNSIKPKEKKLEYVVQLSASGQKIKNAGGKWTHVDNVLIRYENNLYKYQVGTMPTYEEALSTKDKLKQLGFHDCFVVAYFNDKPIDVKEAMKMQGK